MKTGIKSAQEPASDTVTRITAPEVFPCFIYMGLPRAAAGVMQ